MKSKFTFIFLSLVVVFLAGSFISQSIAQVNVTMRINTSTCLDTLRPTDVVQIRGESTGSTTLTWSNTSGAIATNLGGDYWEVTFQALPGNVIKYKIWTGFSLSPEAGTFHWTGWEGPIDAGTPSGDNRLFTVGNTDTTLALQYYNGWENKVAQYWRPFQSKQDSIAIYFRVNMGGVAFNPATQLVDVRGGLPLGGATSWTTIKTLSREANSVNSGSFQSGVIYIHKDSIIVGTSQQQFKFVIQPDIWESSSNRSFVFSGTNDTTIHWYYFNNRAPSGPAVTADLLFRLKLDALEKVGLFDESLGDKVAVTGAKGWPPSGFDFDTEPTLLKMTYNTTLEEWNLVENFTKFPGEILEYKYYVAWDTSRVDTASSNYIPGLDLTNGWEEPGVTGGGNRIYSYSNQTQQFPLGDFGEDQQFFNSIDSRGVITTPITVAFKINMTTATNIAGNPTNPLFRPGIDSVFIQFDGSFVPVTQGLPMYGTANRILLEDLDGDLVYTNSWDLNPPTFYQLCFQIVYTSTSGDITNGGGVQRGRRYYQYVHPSSVVGQTITWPISYQLTELPWMLDSLTVEDPPSFITDAEDLILSPNQYSISQNYPNPFNPVTRIKYNIPERLKVKLQVFDITGRLVKILSNAEQEKGTHIVDWSGNDNFGNSVASGIYFLKFNAGSYTKTVKMMMMK